MMDNEPVEGIQLLAFNFVNRLVLRKFEEASLEFDESMKAVFNAEKLGETWEKYVHDAGSLIQILPVKTAEMDGYTVVLIQCEFQILKIDVQVVFNRQDQISGLSFTPKNAVYNPPSYVDDESFNEFEVTVGSGAWKLPGILTIPNGKGPFKCVVLVHGSGPNDLDETIGPNKPFKDLAWGFASNGIAVLRYDKRTFAHSKELTPEVVQKMTVKEEVVDDAILALKILEENDLIDSKSVFVLGHSLGATLTPRINENYDKICGLIIMAGFTRSLEDVIFDQFHYIYSLSGNITADQMEDLENLKQKVEHAKGELPETTLATDLPLNIPVDYWKDLHNYDPLKTIEKLKSSVLILQGGRDYQVSSEKDFKEWKRVLNQSNRATFKLFPKLNHFFITGEGRSNPEEYMEEGHVDEEVIETICSWIKAHDC